MQIRKIIAKRLLESKMEVPHCYLRGHADLRTVNSLRQILKEQGSKVASVPASGDFGLETCQSVQTHVSNAAD